jgi:hypothetical protein
MDKGARSLEEIAAALETQFGVICLTRDNLHEPWVLFEAGALSKTRGARVWTLLLDLAPADVEPPLSQFLSTHWPAKRTYEVWFELSIPPYAMAVTEAPPTACSISNSTCCGLISVLR